MNIRKELSFYRPRNKYIVLQAFAALGAVGYGKVIAIYFLPTAYGTYFLATSMVALYSTVIASPIIQSYRHYYVIDKEKQILDFYRSVFIWFSVVLAIIMSIVVLAVGIPTLVIVLAMTQILVTNISSLQIANINIQGHTITQAILQVMAPVINVLILFIIIALNGERDFTGIWIALVITEIVVLAGTFWIFSGNRTIRFYSIRELLLSSYGQGILKFVKPLLGLPIFVWMVNNLDRYLLDLYYTKNEVGMYSAVYGLGAKLSILVSGSIVAYLNARVYTQVLNPEGHNRLYQQTIRRVFFFLCGGFILVLGIYGMSDIIGKVFLSPAYSQGFALIPVLFLANLLLASVFFPEQVLYAAGKTRYILLHYIFGAGCNLLLNLILLPKYGVWGAAWAMVGSSLMQICIVMFLLRYVLKKHSSRS